MGLKGRHDRADESAMELPSIGVLVVNALIAGAAVLGMLSIFASRLGYACDLHDLKRDCERLRRQYAERLAALEASFAQDVETEIVGQVSPEEARALAA